MREVVVVWFDDAVLNDEALTFVREQLIELFGEGGYLLLPIGADRIEVLK